MKGHFNQGEYMHGIIAHEKMFSACFLRNMKIKTMILIGKCKMIQPVLKIVCKFS